MMVVGRRSLIVLGQRNFSYSDTKPVNFRFLHGRAEAAALHVYYEMGARALGTNAKNFRSQAAKEIISLYTAPKTSLNALYNWVRKQDRYNRDWFFFLDGNWNS